MLTCSRARLFGAGSSSGTQREGARRAAADAKSARVAHKWHIVLFHVWSPFHHLLDGIKIMNECGRFYDTCLYIAVFPCAAHGVPCACRVERKRAEKKFARRVHVITNKNSVPLLLSVWGNKIARAPTNNNHTQLSTFTAKRSAGCRAQGFGKFSWKVFPRKWVIVCVWLIWRLCAFGRNYARGP